MAIDAADGLELADLMAYASHANRERDAAEGGRAATKVKSLVEATRAQVVACRVKTICT